MEYKWCFKREGNMVGIGMELTQWVCLTIVRIPKYQRVGHIGSHAYTVFFCVSYLFILYHDYNIASSFKCLEKGCTV